MLKESEKETQRKRREQPFDDVPYKHTSSAPPPEWDCLSAAALAHLKCPSILQPSINKQTTWVLGSIYVFRCTVSFGRVNPTHRIQLPPYPMRLHQSAAFVSILSVACHSNAFYFAFTSTHAYKHPCMCTHTHTQSHTSIHICVANRFRADFGTF